MLFCVCVCVYVQDVEPPSLQWSLWNRVARLELVFNKHEEHNNNINNSVIIMICVLLFVFLLRGTTAPFPLTVNRHADTQYYNNMNVLCCSLVHVLAWVSVFSCDSDSLWIESVYYHPKERLVRLDLGSYMSKSALALCQQPFSQYIGRQSGPL